MLTFEAIRALPKISLHDHLDGGLRPQTIIELSNQQGFDLPTQDPKELQSWVFEKCSKGTLEDYLDIFSITSRVMQDAESLTRVAEEFVEDLFKDGVVYGECRWAPFAHIRGELSVEEAVNAVSRGLSRGMSKYANQKRSIVVNQLFCALRHEDHSQALVNLAISNKHLDVVGVDLAGPEDGFPAFKHGSAFKFAAQNGLGVTIHAGEGAGVASIKSAVVDASATRLGHGVRLAEDIHEDGTLGPVASLVKDSGVTLELAPTSNLQTKAGVQWGDSISNHPFNLLFRAGFRVTVSPDNRLMSNTSVSKELYELSKAHQYAISDLFSIQQNAVRAAFLSAKEKDRLLKYLRQSYGS